MLIWKLEFKLTQVEPKPVWLIVLKLAVPKRTKREEGKQEVEEGRKERKRGKRIIRQL